MNIRIACLGLVFLASLGVAQESTNSAKTGAAERAAMLETLQRGKEITVRNERYQLLPEVAAVERKLRQETPQQALAPLGAGAGQIIETKGSFVLFRSSPRKAAMVEERGGAVVYPTVLNTRSGTLGVLTGTLVVVPKSMGDAAGIASQYGLAMEKEYPHIGTVFFRVKANGDIADAATALQSDSRIENAYPEIVEYMHAPK